MDVLQRRGGNWSTEETEALLDIWGQPNIQQKMLETECNHSLDVYNHISDLIREVMPTFSHSGVQCRSKIRRLKQEYTMTKNQNDPSSFPFYRRMEQVFLERSMIVERQERRKLEEKLTLHDPNVLDGAGGDVSSLKTEVDDSSDYTHATGNFSWIVCAELDMDSRTRTRSHGDGVGGELSDGDSDSDSESERQSGSPHAQTLGHAGELGHGCSADQVFADASVTAQEVASEDVRESASKHEPAVGSEDQPTASEHEPAAGSEDQPTSPAMTGSTVDNQPSEMLSPPLVIDFACHIDTLQSDQSPSGVKKFLGVEEGNSTPKAAPLFKGDTKDGEITREIKLISECKNCDAESAEKKKITRTKAVSQHQSTGVETIAESLSPTGKVPSKAASQHQSTGVEIGESLSPAGKVPSKGASSHINKDLQSVANWSRNHAQSGDDIPPSPSQTGLCVRDRPGKDGHFLVDQKLANTEGTSLANLPGVTDSPNQLYMLVKTGGPQTLVTLETSPSEGIVDSEQQGRVSVNPSNNSLSQVRQVNPSNNSLSQVRQVIPSNNSFSQVHQVDPSNISFSQVRQVNPSNNSLSQVRQVDPSNNSLSQVRQVDPSNNSLSQIRQVNPSNISFSQVNQINPSNSSLSQVFEVSHSNNSISQVRKVDPSNNSISQVFEVNHSNNSISQVRQVNPSNNSISRVRQVNPSSKPRFILPNRLRMSALPSGMPTLLSSQKPHSISPGSAVSLLPSSQNFLPGSAVSLLPSSQNFLPGSAVSLLPSSQNISPGSAVSLLSSSQNVSPGSVASLLSSSQNVSPGSVASLLSSSQNVSPGSVASLLSSSQNVSPGSAVSLLSSSQNVSPGSVASLLLSSQNVSPGSVASNGRKGKPPYGGCDVNSRSSANPSAQSQRVLKPQPSSGSTWNVPTHLEVTTSKPTPRVIPISHQQMKEICGGTLAQSGLMTHSYEASMSQSHKSVSQSGNPVSTSSAPLPASKAPLTNTMLTSVNPVPRKIMVCAEPTAGPSSSGPPQISFIIPPSALAHSTDQPQSEMLNEMSSDSASKKPMKAFVNNRKTKKSLGGKRKLTDSVWLSEAVRSALSDPPQSASEMGTQNEQSSNPRTLTQPIDLCSPIKIPRSQSIFPQRADNPKGLTGSATSRRREPKILVTVDRTQGSWEQQLYSVRLQRMTLEEEDTEFRRILALSQLSEQMQWWMMQTLLARTCACSSSHPLSSSGRPVDVLPRSLSELVTGTDEDLGTLKVKAGLELVNKGGFILEVTSPEEARVAEEAGACAVMVVEQVPDNIHGPAPMTSQKKIKDIMGSVAVPVVAKCGIGHFAQAQILQTVGVAMVSESEEQTLAGEENIYKHDFTVPFACVAQDLGEALRRISEGAAVICTKRWTGSVMETVQCARTIRRQIGYVRTLDSADLHDYARQMNAPYHLLKKTAQFCRLPVAIFAAGNFATPADVSLLMQLGVDGVLVGATGGIFQRSEPRTTLQAMAMAVTHYKDTKTLLSLGQRD